MCFLLVYLGLHIFPALNCISLITFHLLGVCWDALDMLVSLLSDKLPELQQLTYSVLQMQPVTVHQVMSFLGKTTFCAN